MLCTRTSKFLLTVCLSLCVTVASAHDFYDPECCSDQDCAPVLKIEKSENGDLMTSKHGTILVNPNDTSYEKRPSPDDKFHVCQQRLESEYGTGAHVKLLCVYYPVQI